MVAVGVVVAVGVGVAVGVAVAVVVAVGVGVGVGVVVAVVVAVVMTTVKVPPDLLDVPDVEVVGCTAQGFADPKIGAVSGFSGVDRLWLLDNRQLTRKPSTVLARVAGSTGVWAARCTPGVEVQPVEVAA